MARESFWQFTQADGSPDWPTGADNFQHIWNRAFEILKFFKPGGFTIEDRSSGKVGPKHSLKEVEGLLRQNLVNNADTVFVVRSLRTGHGLAFRRHTEELATKGKQFLDRGRELIGTPYDLGGIGQAGVDCSGVVIYESNGFGIEWGPFYTNRAQVMWDEAREGKPGKVIIPRTKILKGDLLVIHDGDHIATYIDEQDGGRALDAQPSSCMSPWGWTPAGCQVRSMAPAYYDAWANVNAIIRLIKVNGQP
jgi:hypothetical protein